MTVGEVKLLPHVDAQVMSLGKHSLVLAGVWEKLANHELGRAALASVAVCQQGAVQPSVSQDLSDPEPAQPPDRDNPPFLVLWQKISVEFESNKTLRPSLVGVIYHFARGANALSHQGQRLACTWQSSSHHVACFITDAHMLVITILDLVSSL